MGNPDRLLAFVLLAALLIVAPGPSVLFVVSRALVHGRRGAIATVLGNALGEYALVGAVYLGIRTIRQRRSLVSMLTGRSKFRGSRRAFREGFVVGATNPKSAIFFAAILPQFVDRAGDNAPLQLLLLGLIYFAIALVADTTFCLIAGGARSWLANSPRRMAAIGGASGLVMIGPGSR